MTQTDFDKMPLKAKLIFAMGTIMENLNDENLLDSWFPWGVETMDDALDMQEYYEDISRCFSSLVRKATNDGLDKWLYIPDEKPEAESK